MHAELYGHQNRLTRDDLVQHAKTVGLDLDAYAACLEDPQTGAAIAKDSEEAGRLKVDGTPRTFINGRLFAGALSEDLLTFVIRVELGEVTGAAAESYVEPARSAPGMPDENPETAP